LIIITYKNIVLKQRICFKQIKRTIKVLRRSSSIIPCTMRWGANLLESEHVSRLHCSRHVAT